MRLDDKLNLVLPVVRDDGSTIYIHSTPISRDVFETYFLVISKTFSEIYTEGLNVVSGPRIAAMMLRKVATEMGIWDTVGGVRDGLMQEIRRLSNVVYPADNGWATLPLSVAAERKIIDSEDIWEAENTIVFFIVNSTMHKKRMMPSVLERMRDLWAIQTSQLNSTGFLASLATSTETANSGGTAVASSVVY